MGEDRHDFLHVVGDEDEGGGGPALPQPLDHAEKMLAGRRIESGARFVEDQDPRMRHQGAGDEHPLAFALGEDTPRAVRRMGAADLAQQSLGLLALRRGEAAQMKFRPVSEERENSLLISILH